MFEDWDEGYEPPESATYAGSCEPSVPPAASASKPVNISDLREQIRELTGAISDVRGLLSRQHKMAHDDFITELSWIITAAVLIGKPDTITKDAP